MVLFIGDGMVHSVEIIFRSGNTRAEYIQVIRDELAYELHSFCRLLGMLIGREEFLIELSSKVTRTG
jgi:hypothetical protein